MAERQMTLTEAHANFINFLALFEGIESLRDAAAVVLETVGDPTAAQRLADSARADLERWSIELTRIRDDVARAKVEHETTVLRLGQEANTKRDQLANEARVERERTREETRRLESEEVAKQRKARAETDRILQGLDADVAFKQQELQVVTDQVHQANNELETVRATVAPKGR